MSSLLVPILLSAGRLPCRALLFCAVSRWVWCRRVLWCFLWCSVVSWCAVWSCPLVCCAVLRCVGGVGSPCSAPPPAVALVIGPVTFAWSPLVARCCALSWGAVLCCSAVPPVVRCAVVTVVSCCVVLSTLVCARPCRVVARCLWVFVAWSGWLLLSFGCVRCRLCPCLAASPAALLCAVVCGGARFPCAVSCGAVFRFGAVLWCPAVCFALLLVLICFLGPSKPLQNL